MEQIIYLGENGFRRANPDIYIDFLREVDNKKLKNNEDIMNKLISSGVYQSTKQKEKDKRGFHVLSRMNLLAKRDNRFCTTALAKKLIEGKDSEAIEKFGYGKFEFLIGLICESEKREISFIREFIKNLKYSEQSFREIFIKINKEQYTLKTQIKTFKDFIKFIYKFTNNSTESQKQKTKSRLIFWEQYENIYKDISQEIKKEEILPKFYKLIRYFKDLKENKNDFWLEVLGVDLKLLNKKILKQEDVNPHFNYNTFRWINSEESIQDMAKKYKLNTSISDNIDITRRQLALFPGFHFSSKKIGKKTEHFVKLNNEHKEFMDYMKNNYEKLRKILMDNHTVKYIDLCNYIDITLNIKNKISIKSFIESLQWDDIEEIITSFIHEDPKKTKQLIDKNPVFDSNSATLPTWFEYFTALKLIKISDFKNDETIWNGKFDPDYKPISHAAGGRPDISFSYNGKNIICEVTLSTGDSQEKMEANPVKRHIVRFGADKAIFMAPKIDPNTKRSMLNDYFDSITERDYKMQGKIIFIEPKDFVKLNNIEQIYEQ